MAGTLACTAASTEARVLKVVCGGSVGLNQRLPRPVQSPMSPSSFAGISMNRLCPKLTRCGSETVNPSRPRDRLTKRRGPLESGPTFVCGVARLITPRLEGLGHVVDRYLQQPS